MSDSHTWQQFTAMVTDMRDHPKHNYVLEYRGHWLCILRVDSLRGWYWCGYFFPRDYERADALLQPHRKVMEDVIPRYSSAQCGFDCASSIYDYTGGAEAREQQVYRSYEFVLEQLKLLANCYIVLSQDEPSSGSDTEEIRSALEAKLIKTMRADRCENIEAQKMALLRASDMHPFF
jgi:hypothetical protein